MWTARRLQRRLNVELGLRLLPAVAWAGATGFVAGRLLWPRAAVVLGCVGVAAGAGWLTRVVRRDAWRETDAAIVLDRLAGAGGLLLALREARGGGWNVALDDRLAGVKPPPLQVKRALLLGLAGLAFGALGLLVRVPIEVQRPVNAAAQAKVESLEAKAEALAQEHALTAELAAEIDRLRDEVAEGRFDAGDWAAGDEAGAAMDEAARARTEELARAAAAAEALAKDVEQGVEGEAMQREREELEEALAALEEEKGAEDRGAQGNRQDSETAEKQGDPKKAEGEPKSGEGKQGAAGKPGANGEGKEPGKDERGKAKARAPATREGLQALRDALDRRKEQIGKQFGQGQAGRQAAEGGRRRGEGEGQGKGTKKGPAGPGPGHGPADPSPLEFGDETEFEPDRLAYEELPKGRGGGEPLDPVGMSRRAPKKGPRGATDGAAGGVAGTDDTPSAAAEAVPPRHRELVRKYFEAQ